MRGVDRDPAGSLLRMLSTLVLRRPSLHAAPLERADRECVSATGPSGAGKVPLPGMILGNRMIGIDLGRDIPTTGLLRDHWAATARQSKRNSRSGRRDRWRLQLSDNGHRLHRDRLARQGCGAGGPRT